MLNLFHLYKTTPIPLSNQYNVQYRPLRRPYCKSYFLWLMVAQAEEVIVSNDLPWDLASFFGWVCWSTYDAILLGVFMWMEQMLGTIISHPQETLNSRRKEIVYIFYPEGYFVIQVSYILHLFSLFFHRKIMRNRKQDLFYNRNIWICLLLQLCIMQMGYVPF